MVDHADLDHTGLPGIGSGGGAVEGQAIYAFPVGFGVVASTTSALVASAAYLAPIKVTAPMQLTAAVFLVSGAGSGTHQWGLFDCSADATACTKLAGGSGALNATGEVVIAATGAPVSVPAGDYLFIIHAPAANVATLRVLTPTVSAKFQQSQTAYAWDDTPNVVAGWGGASTTVRMFYLLGRVDATNAL